jgi:hypothetical protein
VLLEHLGELIHRRTRRRDHLRIHPARFACAQKLTQRPNPGKPDECR